MERLEEIDRQLEALGKPMAQLSAAIERVLGQDRSLARIDEILSGLGEVPPGMLKPRVTSSLPPRRGSTRPGSARSTLVSMTPAPEAAPAPAPASSWPPRAGRSSLPPRIVTPIPSLSSPVPSVAAPSPWPPRPAPEPASEAVSEAAPESAPEVAALPRMPRITDTLVDTPLAPLPPVAPSEEDLDAETAALLGGNSMPSAVPLPFGPSVETGLSAGETGPSGETPTRVGPPPGEIEAAAEALQAAQEARERRDNVRALLDQEIDPSDFPSQRPPKAEDDGVEMLLEDDEILEIEDDELLEDEDAS